jgi:hypothetical protein
MHFTFNHPTIQKEHRLQNKTQFTNNSAHLNKQVYHSLLQNNIIYKYNSVLITHTIHATIKHIDIRYKNTQSFFIPYPTFYRNCFLVWKNHCPVPPKIAPEQNKIAKEQIKIAKELFLNGSFQNSPGFLAYLYNVKEAYHRFLSP